MTGAPSAWAQASSADELGQPAPQTRPVTPPPTPGESAAAAQARQARLVAALGERRALSLGEVLAMAADEHPSIHQARVGVQVAEAQRKAARGNFGPRLTADASAQLWNEELAFDIGGGGEAPQLPAPATPYEELIYGMFAAPSEPTVIRAQFTWSASLTISQPLGPLWAIYHGYKAAELGEEVAREQVDQARRDRARDAARAYFQLLQARAALDTALQSVERLQAQVDRMDALVAAGAAMSADKLRIEVGLASAQQGVARLKSSIQVAGSALAVAIGLDPSESIGAQPLREDIALPRLGELSDEDIAAALASRPELLQLQLQMEQAERAVKIQQGGYIPQAVAIAQYSHAEGQGLAGSDSAFIGLSASWDLWKWGADYYAIDAARAQRLQLDFAQKQVRRQLELQVRSAWYDLQSSLEAYEVSLRAVDQAREAYRVEAVRYEAGESTPTDLLDAQSALTEAENNRNGALFQALIQNAELVYATGRPLTVDLLIGGSNP